MQFCIGTTAKIDAVDLVKQAETSAPATSGWVRGAAVQRPLPVLALAARDTSNHCRHLVTNPLTRIAPVTAARSPP
jgi:hypothetical protein